MTNNVVRICTIACLALLFLFLTTTEAFFSDGLDDFDFNEAVLRRMGVRQREQPRATIGSLLSPFSEGFTPIPSKAEDFNNAEMAINFFSSEFIQVAAAVNEIKNRMPTKSKIEELNELFKLYKTRHPDVTPQNVAEYLEADKKAALETLSSSTINNNDDPLQKVDFTPLQGMIDLISTGKCREFKSTTNTLDAFWDSSSVCATVIQPGTNVFVVTQSFIPAVTAMLGTAMGQSTAARSLSPLIGLGDPTTDCDLAIFGYLCGLIYAPCEIGPEVMGENNGIPHFPCEVEYKQGELIERCPELEAMGMFEMPLPGVGVPMPFAKSETCNKELAPPPRTYQQTPAILFPEPANTLPPYECNKPLATVDPFSYPYQRIMGGYCALPCPSYLFDEEDYKFRDRFFIGWSVISNIIGTAVMISYWFLPNLKGRIFINLGMTITMFQSLWTWFPYIDTVNRLGIGQGARILCRGPAAEQLGSNFNCTVSGWSTLFSLLGVGCCLNFLGMGLIEKIMFPNWIAGLTPKQKKIKEWVSIGLVFFIPLVCCIVVSGYGQWTGGSAAMLYCYFARERLPPGKLEQTAPDMSLYIGFIVPGIVIGISYLELFILIFYIFKILWVSRTTNRNNNWTLLMANIRILVAIVIISTLGIGTMAFRSWIDNNRDKMEKAATDWVSCLMTAATQDSAKQCGTKPNPAFPVGWGNFLLWSIATRGLTYVIGIGFSMDIVYGWAAFWYHLFGIKALKEWAKKGGLEHWQAKGGKSRTNMTYTSRTDSNQSVTHSGVTQTAMSKTDASSTTIQSNAKQKMFGNRKRPGAGAGAGTGGLASPVSPDGSSHNSNNNEPMSPVLNLPPTASGDGLEMTSITLNNDDSNNCGLEAQIHNNPSAQSQ